MIPKRFWDKVSKTDTCWLWTAATSAKGYGRFGVNGKNRLAYHYLWTELNGPVPDGMKLDHRCRVKHCVNPSHLQLTSNKENCENQESLRRSTTGVRGVSWHRRLNKYQVSVKHNQKIYHGGYFDTLSEAAAAAVVLRNELFTNNLVDRGENV